MPELVALAVPPGPAFLDALRRIWDDGDAVLPLDPHAPAPHRDRLLNALAPSAVVEADGTRHHRSGGRPVEDGDAVVIATSGTTGAPRGAVHTHAGVAAAARMTSAACGATSSDVGWLACLPLGHVGGFSVITRALLAGTGLEIHDRPDAARIDDAARRGATHVSLVPTLLGRIDPARWRAILLGGSAVPVRRPDNTIATYGMTETFGGVVYDGLALDGVAIRIGSGPDGDSGPEGPIELRSPSLMRAYRDGTDPRTDDGWYRTGDRGSIDAAGVLRVAGRTDDLIITGGVNVWPAPVEDRLRTHPAVADVAVLGVADAEWGQRVRAVVVPSDPRHPPTLDELRSHVKEHLPAAAAPRELLLVDVLPRTALGKISRYELSRRSGPDERSGSDDRRRGTGKVGSPDAHP